MTPAPDFRRRLAALGLTTTLLAVGVLPPPDGWARAALQSLRSPGPNRADHDASAGGYYENLLGRPDAPRDEWTQRVLGPIDPGVSIHDIGAIRYLEGSFLEHDLAPDVRRTAFGVPFQTNSCGLRDREYPVRKPPGTFRIALLGSSIDMGWGVAADAVYARLLEQWLNARAARLGRTRRFEVLNFAVAAYSPAQRLESYRRKAVRFDPDLVLYATTMLDPRLTAIHLCCLLRGRTDLRYDFIREAVAAAGIAADDVQLDAHGELLHKTAVRARLKAVSWPVAAGALGALAADCRAAGRSLACLIVPRVGPADAPAPRAEAVARLRAIAARHPVPVLDLSPAFDVEDPADLAIAACDDHPNARGHRLLFRALVRALVQNEAMDPVLFGGDFVGWVKPTKALE